MHNINVKQCFLSCNDNLPTPPFLYKDNCCWRLYSPFLHLRDIFYQFEEELVFESKIYFVYSNQIKFPDILFIIFYLCILTFFYWFSWRTPHWDVKNCACRNESILIMLILVPLIGMFCFINYILLSEVKMYLNNFMKIVTKI